MECMMSSKLEEIIKLPALTARLQTVKISNSLTHLRVSTEMSNMETTNHSLEVLQIPMKANVLLLEKLRRKETLNLLLLLLN
jgi:hypothetical protein